MNTWQFIFNILYERKFGADGDILDGTVQDSFDNTYPPRFINHGEGIIWP